MIISALQEPDRILKKYHGLGITPITWIYDAHIDPDKTGNWRPDLLGPQIEAIVPKDFDGYLGIDWEGVWLSAIHNGNEGNGPLKRGISLLRFVHTRRPNARVGFYNIMRPRPLWSITAPGKVIDWEKNTEFGFPLFDRCDWLSINCYRNRDRYDDRGNHAEACYFAQQFGTVLAMDRVHYAPDHPNREGGRRSLLLRTPADITRHAQALVDAGAILSPWTPDKLSRRMDHRANCGRYYDAVSEVVT